MLITKSQKTTIQLNSLNYQVAYRKDSAGNNFERFSFTNGYQDQIGREVVRLLLRFTAQFYIVVARKIQSSAKANNNFN